MIKRTFLFGKKTTHQLYFKLKAFDTDKIKNSTNEDLKTQLRSTVTIGEAIKIFNSF